MISSNISSIGANQTMFNTSANNVANVNTDGFVPSQTTIQNQDGNTPEAMTRMSDNNNSPKSQTDLAQESTAQALSTTGVDANVKAVQTQNEMIGSLLDISV